MNLLRFKTSVESSRSQKTMKKLTILAAPMQAVGHITASAGALTGLLKRGHRVIFVITKLYQGNLKKYGYEEYIIPPTEEESKISSKNLALFLASVMQEAKIIGPYTPKEKEENCRGLYASPIGIAHLSNIDKAVKSAIEEYQPDLVWADAERFPAIMYSGIPWIYNISDQPLSHNLDDTLPPGGSGLPTDSDPSEWSEWSELRWWRQYKCPQYNDLVEKMGYARFPDDKYPQTQLLSVYAIPEEINYPQLRANQSWFNIEVFNKPQLKNDANLAEFVPKVFLDNNLEGKFTGKLIYLSMGSMGSADLDLMNRLVSTLAQTNHKYIVSTGPRYDEYELAANMWGEEFVPQTSIIAHVDLVITHGGNNTFTETFAIGKPMIVLPLFTDQYDNAQRLHETGFGTRIDAYAFTGPELIEAIGNILSDSELVQKLKKASQRILSSNHHEELALLIESKLGEL